MDAAINAAKITLYQNSSLLHYCKFFWAKRSKAAGFNSNWCWNGTLDLLGLEQEAERSGGGGLTSRLGDARRAYHRRVVAKSDLYALREDHVVIEIWRRFSGLVVLGFIAYRETKRKNAAVVAVAQ